MLYPTPDTFLPRSTFCCDRSFKRLVNLICESSCCSFILFSSRFRLIIDVSRLSNAFCRWTRAKTRSPAADFLFLKDLVGLSEDIPRAGRSFLLVSRLSNKTRIDFWTDVSFLTFDWTLLMLFFNFSFFLNGFRNVFIRNVLFLRVFFRFLDRFPTPSMGLIPTWSRAFEWISCVLPNRKRRSWAELLYEWPSCKLPIALLCIIEFLIVVCHARLLHKFWTSAHSGKHFFNAFLTRTSDHNNSMG